jgi:hypothetical protein
MQGTAESVLDGFGFGEGAADGVLDEEPTVEVVALMCSRCSPEFGSSGSYGRARTAGRGMRDAGCGMRDAGCGISTRTAL